MAASAGLKLVRDNPSPDRFPRSDRTITSGELAPAECLALEPALQLDIDEFAGGIFTASEQIGVLCGAYVPPETATQYRMAARRGCDWPGAIRRPPTLACGSARLTADMIDRKPEATGAEALALRCMNGGHRHPAIANEMEPACPIDL